jgi:hypothetical protein
MSFTFTVDHEHRRVTARAEGPITLADIRRHLEEERGESRREDAEEWLAEHQQGNN